MATTNAPTHVEFLLTFNVIEKAILASNNCEKGCSVVNIKKHIREQFGENADSVLRLLKSVVDSALQFGALKRPSGHEDQRGLTGSLVLGDSETRKAFLSSSGNKQPKPLGLSNKANVATGSTDDLASTPVQNAKMMKKNQKFATEKKAAATPKIKRTVKKTNSNAALNVEVLHTPTSILKPACRDTASENRRLVFASPLIFASSPNLVAAVSEEQESEPFSAHQSADATDHLGPSRRTPGSKLLSAGTKPIAAMSTAVNCKSPVKVPSPLDPTFLCNIQGKDSQDLIRKGFMISPAALDCLEQSSGTSIRGHTKQSSPKEQLNEKVTLPHKAKGLKK